MSDSVCRHARQIAPRFKTTQKLVEFLNQAHGLSLTHNALEIRYKRWRVKNDAPRLKDLLGTGPVTDFVDDDTESGIPLTSVECQSGDYTPDGRTGMEAALTRDSDEPDLKELQSCIPWASSIERQAVEAFAMHGTVAGAAEALNMSVRLLRGLMSDMQRKAAIRGWSPQHDMKKTTPDGFHVKGVSTLYDEDGNVKGQWVKTKKDESHRLLELLDAVQALAEPFTGLVGPTLKPVPGTLDEDLLTCYPIGDPHFGMFSWAQETGEDFDLKIAERDLLAAVDHLVDISPASKEAIVCSLGDAFHADGKANTTTGGTPVDVDTRWSKVFGVVVKAMRYCITRALQKHEKVRVICVTGNHDEHLSLVLAHCLAAFFENEPRVEVDVSPAKFFWHVFGKCLLGFHHGDKVKKDNLASVMACDQAENWGKTLYRKWYVGHFHHEQVKEYPGCVVETYRTLAAKDAWHSAQGYRALQDMKCEVWHKEWGLITRHAVGIRQVRAGRK